MVADRSAEDIVSGVLRIPMGGKEHIVPTLPIGPNRKWLALLHEKVGAFVAIDWSRPDFGQVGIDDVLDLVMAYDRSHALGTRKWIEEHADPPQVYEAAQAMTRVAIPFVVDVQGLIAMVAGFIVARGVGLSQPSSTNGLSPSGDSTPAGSIPASIPSN